MQALLAKLPNVDAKLRVLSAQELGTRADHFAWLKAPDAVADSFSFSWMKIFTKLLTVCADIRIIPLLSQGARSSVG